jgi:hypothetical protein
MTEIMHSNSSHSIPSNTRADPSEVSSEKPNTVKNYSTASSEEKTLKNKSEATEKTEYDTINDKRELNSSETSSESEKDNFTKNHLPNNPTNKPNIHENDSEISESRKFSEELTETGVFSEDSDLNSPSKESPTAPQTETVTEINQLVGSEAPSELTEDSSSHFTENTEYESTNEDEKLISTETANGSEIKSENEPSISGINKTSEELSTNTNPPGTETTDDEVHSNSSKSPSDSAEEIKSRDSHITEIDSLKEASQRSNHIENLKSNEISDAENMSMEPTSLDGFTEAQENSLNEASPSGENAPESSENTTEQEGGTIVNRKIKRRKKRKLGKLISLG